MKPQAEVPNASLEPSWGKMLIFSLLFHLAVFSMVFLVPDTGPARRIQGTVYEVNLVELPPKRAPAPAPKSSAKAAKRVTPKIKPTPTKRIARPKPKAKEKPVVIAKRTLKKKSPPKKVEPAPRKSSSELIDQAVSKIKNKVEKERNQKDHLEEAISDLERKVAEAEARASRGGGSPGGGILEDIYRMQVADWIRSNWSYPVALSTEDSQRLLEAVVVVKVDRSGRILTSWFQERSENAVFNQSVEKAVERSNPVPPFPESFTQAAEELEVRFNLSELEEL